MSSFSSFLFPNKLVGSSNARDSKESRLRFALETMPGSRKYVFTPATRAEILTELYDAFWGPYGHLFLPPSQTTLPTHSTLAQIQAQVDRVVISSKRAKAASDASKNCALDDSCVLCSRCFHATNHVDHSVTFFIAQQSGGCCDCGDEEAALKPISCPHHPLLDSAHATPKVSRSTLPDQPPSVKDFPYRANVPPELRESMNRTVGYALDFLLDTLDFSPDEPSVPPNEADLRLQSSADPMMKDQYCVVVWNDDKHSFEETAQVIADQTNRPLHEAFALVNTIDQQGREVIDMNTNVTRLLEVALAINQIDLGVTIRRAYDTFREQVVAVIIEWLLDLTRVRLGTDTLVLREVIASELLSPRRRDTGGGYSNNTVQIVSDLENPVRLDWMFLYHTRLWKRPRLSLKEIYASVITLSHEHKLAVGAHFAMTYPRILDAFLLVDREAETSIKYFALQLFTVPSVAAHIVRHHRIVTRLLNTITAFFTNQISNKHVTYPPIAKIAVDVDAFPFKSKRFQPVFSDLRHLCQTDLVQRMIATNHDFVVQLAATCQLFMCINPNKRAVETHVEYETDAWISVFNVSLSLSRVIKIYGEALAKASTAQLVAAITTVLHHILLVCTGADERVDREKLAPVEFHDVVFGDAEYDIVEFNVLDGWVSFHQSLHWFLAELFKHVDTLSEESLSEVGLGSIRDIVLRNASERAFLTVIDFPVRVLAMVAQIRTGLWVRNGFAIRGQLLHYRDFVLREFCYDQDLFLLQSALIIIDPSAVFVTILDRFALLDYFSGNAVHTTYEGTQLSSMVEEVLQVFITILSENANACKMDQEQCIRRELVHALAVGPCSFSDLIKRVAERMPDSVFFERVLHEVANFKMPDSITDHGAYELKDEMYDEVNPFYYHYTRNRREEVDTILRARLKKKTGVADPVIVPRPLGITSGPFSILKSAFESEALLQVMFYATFNILVVTNAAEAAPPSAEAILDQVMHLIMLALVERLEVFSRLAVVKEFEEGKTLVDVLCTLEHSEIYKLFNTRVAWILSQMTTVMPEELGSQRRVLDGSQEALPNPDEAKKRAAQARKDAVMKQMKAQQASFQDINFGEGDDDDDDDSMEATPEEDLPFGTCIVCQEDLDSSKAFGTLGLVQPSRLIRRHPDSHNLYLNEVLQAAPSLDRADATSHPPFPHLEGDGPGSKPAVPNFEGFPNQYTRFGLHTSVCSHMMHLECFQVYGASIKQRHRAQATRNHPESILRKEYICPLCKSLGNVIILVTRPSNVQLSSVPFSDWIRSAGISILKSKPDPLLDSLQFRNGTGEFVFWSAQDQGYARNADKWDNQDVAKIIDTVMVVARSMSQQSRHLRDRLEPEAGERGAGFYLPEELVGYTVASMEIAQRGVSAPPNGILADNLTDSHTCMVRGLVETLTKLSALHFKGRADEGREAIRQAIIKRLLPEWSRTSLTSFSYPLLLRDPFTVLVETAAVAPEMLRHVLVLTYYACLARTVIGLVYVLNKTRSHSTVPVTARDHEDVFGDVRMFFTSVVRHSPVFEHTATLVFETFGETRIGKLLYAFTLPFLRRAIILCRSILPNAFPTPAFPEDMTSEYNRLLLTLNIPPLSDLPNQDTLQNALSGWCAHYGHSHAASQLNCGVVLDYPCIYKVAKLPMILDNLLGDQVSGMVCQRCNTVPLDAAICLICGTVVCFQSHCCVDGDTDQSIRGECNMHTRECGGAIGVYFLVKRCSLLYLYAGNGTFAQSPYLDVNGELDVSMRRGRRQYLHHTRWDDIRKTWLNHGIPTVLARRLESTVDNGGWETT